ncbi:GtrA family protein [Amycolatopsis albidoflavus]
MRYSAVGIVTTLGYLTVFAVLRTFLGPFVGNGIALVLASLSSTAANRRLTFGVVGAHRRGRQFLEGFLIFCAGLALTSGALAVVDNVGSPGFRLAELGLLAAAKLSGGILRFALFRVWVFHPRRLSA